MQKKTYRFLPDIYSKDLSVIGAVHFTPREVDIMACLLNMRGTSKIASLLSVAPNTILVHTRNIMVKLGCNSRDSIIDFMESSPKLPYLRDYYASLIREAAFIKALKVVAKLKRKESCEKEYAGGYIYWQDKALKDDLVSHLEEHLRHADIQVVIKDEGQENHPEIIKNSTQSILWLKEKKAFQKTPSLRSDGCLIDLSREKNYYCAVIKICETLRGDLPCENVFKDFIDHYTRSVDFSSSKYPLSYKSGEVARKENVSLREKITGLKRKKWFFMSALFCGVISCIGLQIFKENKEIQMVQKHEELEDVSIRSDLFIPAQAVLLLRPKELARMEEKLSQNTQIQTLALVGPGGIGKTTLARQYAHDQKANIIWELNAETPETLKSSFEDLAQALALTEQDQKILAGFQEIKDPAKREKKLIGFVKQHLKSYPDWLLIYDNVKEFQDIQDYFPKDSKTWGRGKIILTTRNSNIQSSQYINSALPVEELTPAQKLALFMKIIINEEAGSFSTAQMKEATQFLEKIPSYPLDVSIAAYYVKLTNIPYGTYLEHLAQYNKDFATVQEKVLQEVGEYTKTRYGIITLSLQHLIHAHKDFTDLLLFISLLDSQNIPRGLLRLYKNELSIDNFILTLKKYSFITSQSPTSSSYGSTFSMHRSTQEIILAYLTQSLNLEKNKPPLTSISHTLARYVTEGIEREDLAKLRLLVNHCEVFLGHQNLLTPDIQRLIRGELGGVYLYLGNYDKAKTFCEKSLVRQKQNYQINLGNARALAYLGNVYGDLGHYDKAQNILEKSLTLYKKHFPQNYAGMARALSSLGNVHRDVGSYEKAKEFLEESFLIYTKYFPENHASKARTAGYLGIVYTILEDYNKAEDLLGQSLLIYQTHLSKNQAAIAWVLAHQGDLYERLGNHEKAKTLFEQSITLYKECFPEGHIKTGWALSALGDVYRALGDYNKAKEVLEESLLIYKKHLSENHIVVAGILVYLGAVYKDLGDYEKAQELIEKSFITYNKHFPKDHSEVAWALAHLGDTYRALGAHEKAKSLLEESVAIYRKNFSKNHSELIWAEECLKKIYQEMEKE